MKRRSIIRALQERLYAKVRLWYFVRHPRCEACQTKKATEIHHKAGREGWLLCFVDHFMAVCHDCHEWITNNGKAAKERGWKYEVQGYDKNAVEEQARHLAKVSASDRLLDQ